MHYPTRDSKPLEPMPYLKAILFDMDGVLADSEGLKLQAWQESLEPYGLSMTSQDYQLVVGLSSKDMISRLLSDTEVARQASVFINHKNAHYAKLQKQGVKAIEPGLAFFKKVLAHKNTYDFKLGIVSSGSRAEIVENCRQLGIDPKSLDLIASGRDDLQDIVDASGTNKPKPYIYQRAARLLDLEPCDCLVIEDSATGVTAGIDAGMKVIAVPNQWTQAQEFAHATLLGDFNRLNRLDLVKIVSQPAIGMRLGTRAQDIKPKLRSS